MDWSELDGDNVSGPGLGRVTPDFLPIYQERGRGGGREGVITGTTNLGNI